MFLEFIPAVASFVAGIFKKKIDDSAKQKEADNSLAREREITNRENARLDKTAAMEEAARASLLNQIQAQANASVTISAQRNEESIKVDGTKWNKILNFIRGSVRPGLTWLWNGLYFLCIAVLVWKAGEVIKMLPTEIQRFEAVKELYTLIVDPWFKSTLTSILGFWFGSR
jgi:protein-tyrosine-phosphatase